MIFGQEMLKTKLILGNSISVLKSHELVQRICTISSGIQRFSGGQPHTCSEKCEEEKRVTCSCNDWFS